MEHYNSGGEYSLTVDPLMKKLGVGLQLTNQEKQDLDDDGWLDDPKPGAGWPVVMNLRASGRPPVYRLDRAGVASLGFEGDLLLGWRGGDLIAEELQ